MRGHALTPAMPFLRFFFIVVTLLVALPAQAARPEAVLDKWYGLILELVRHTPTYSPPVASRSFAYFGVTAYEAIASGDADLLTLAGQLNGLQALPSREPDAQYDEAVVLQAAMSSAARNFFFNTGPTGQRALKAMDRKLSVEAAEGVAADVVARSEAQGQAVAKHIFAWSQTDGGARIINLGFPMDYKLTVGPGHWVPTSTIDLQQAPLLPEWGKNRTFAMPNGATCSLPPPPAYSEDKESEFYKQAFETYDTAKNLSAEHRTIARFWSDDPMLSPTPPGHWVWVALGIFAHHEVAIEKQVDVLARLGIAIADGFIGCWDAKFQYDLVRPVTYIKKHIDPKWEPLLITPPFPEYPSGHSTQSGAAATVLAHAFGENFAFADATHERDGLQARNFPSFWAAAEEAAISRLYGGIHFRAAIERGLEQGRCIGAFVNALKTRKN